MTTRFQPDRFSEIRKGRYERDAYGGLRAFAQGRVEERFKHFMTEQDIQELQDAAVETRMPVKNNPYYLTQALKSIPVKNLIKPRAQETFDLAGEADPSSQNDYSPVPGLLHKYPEIVLLYASPTCSAHCRYCYRLDLFTKTTGKEIIKPEGVIDYIRDYNAQVEQHNASVNYDPKQKKFAIREGLLSGGDPMVLPNTQLYTFMTALAEGGLQTIRIGSKEMAFFPYRFDEDFFHMLDTFHEVYPNVHINMMVHFTHPDEFLEIRGEETADGFVPEVDHLAPSLEGRYTKNSNGTFKWRDEVNAAVEGLLGRSFVSVYNQTPIIADVNDHAPALNLMQRALHHKGVSNHYFFQCREIEGHRAFAVPVEKAYEIFRESQRGLSGTERTKFSMSTKWGKMEIVGRFNFANAAMIASQHNLSPAQLKAVQTMQARNEQYIIFRIVRAPHDVKTFGRLIVARSNPDALWLSGYEDRIVYDGRKPVDQQGSLVGNLLGEFFSLMEEAEGDTQQSLVA